LPPADLEALRAELVADKSGLLGGLERRGGRAPPRGPPPPPPRGHPRGRGPPPPPRPLPPPRAPRPGGAPRRPPPPPRHLPPPPEGPDRSQGGKISPAPPTTRALELLAEAGSVRRAIALSAEQSLAPICPAFIPGDPPYLALPGDPSHEVRERRVLGPTRFV